MGRNRSPLSATSLFGRLPKTEGAGLFRQMCCAAILWYLGLSSMLCTISIQIGDAVFQLTAVMAVADSLGLGHSTLNRWMV
ncbi:hypothetical protein [Zhongshania sp.]|uniref:hypothetical protein n=1 Tax=Zhongshania sp. TaxID=1971902 RepID=UPI003569CBA6